MRLLIGLSYILTGLLLVCSKSGFSQGLYEVSTEEKVSRSSLIVEGKVVSQHGYWNPARTMIFTSNQIEVYKVFKGELQKDTIEVITVGGSVDNYAIQASHLLELHTGDMGVFFCRMDDAKPRRLGASREPAFDVYSSSQGFLRYDIISRTATAPFSRFSDIETVLYPDLQKRTGRVARVKRGTFSIEKVRTDRGVISNNSTLAPVISSFSPLTIDAGTLLDPVNNILTINGTGFGSSPSGVAAVEFDNPDDGSGGNFTTVEYNSPLIVSWSNTMIRVKVPGNAGTGEFRVIDNTGVSATSPSNLMVRFSVLNASYTNSQGGPREINLLNANTTGGYTVKYSTSTANNGSNINTSPAKGSFQRAMNTWVESVGANFIDGGTALTQVVNTSDNNNMVMFDNGATGLGAPLGAGVLATCFSGVSICNDYPETAFKPGFDIVIRNEGYSSGSVAFATGPCPPYISGTPQVDLESVLLHELGHALSLGHIIDRPEGSGPGTTNPGKVMHYAVAYNFRRISLDYSSKTGAAYMIAPRELDYGGCLAASPHMIPSSTTIVELKDECPASFPTETTPMFTTVNFDLVHATSNNLVDPAYNQLTIDGTGTGLTNTAYYAFRTNATGGDLSLEIRDYLTVPGPIDACSSSSTGIPVTGVQMAVYQVNSCPAAGSYPAPILSRSFDGNGMMPAITGLAANANYLLVLDGVENTKATFNMVFSGSSLALRFAEFAGSVFSTYNFLNWTTGQLPDVSTVFLERSADGINYQEIAEFTSPADQTDGEYSDNEPLTGDNYYRLSVRHTNGTVQYSQVVLLTRTEGGAALKVFPNPATQVLNVAISNNTPGTYFIVLYNSLGQKVVERRVPLSQATHVENIAVGQLSRGIYRLAILDASSKRIITRVISLQ